MADDNPAKCPVCGSTLKGEPGISQSGCVHYDCDTCGPFAVSAMLANPQVSRTLSVEEKRKLKSLLYEHWISGGEPLMLGGNSGTQPVEGKILISVDELLQRYPREPLEYFDRALVNFSRSARHPADSVVISRSKFAGMFSTQLQAHNLLEQFVAQGYLSTGGASGLGAFSVTPKGWERVRALTQPGRDAKQAFVAMWFDPSHSKFYTDGIRPAIEADGATKSMRIDGKEHNDHIDDQIIAEIRRSRYLVADFRGHRAGVYFEAGFALGLGLPVIWTCHRSDLAAAHFDTRQYNHIEYETPDELREKLLNRIRATIT